MNTSNNNLYEMIKEKLSALREFIAMYLRIIVPAGVLLIVAVVLIVSISVHNAREKSEEEEVKAPVAEAIEPEGQLGSDTVIMAVPEMALEENAYPDVNELIDRYYKAMADGDIDTVRSINNNIDETETIRISETSKYIDRYDSVKVYTKLGPTTGTYLAYVYSEMVFYDYDTAIPGLEAFYICTDDSGKLYINDGEESESVINYIREATLQDDVVDLNNEVAVAYNNMLAEDENLSIFLMDMTDSIDTAVGEALAQAEGSTTPAATEEGQSEDGSASADTGETASSDLTREEITTVKATTTVNIRSSDSETADKLGKASEGQEFKLIEKKGNGWSEIDYNGKSAFIKSEFLEEVGTETVINVAGDNSSANNETDTTASDNTSTNTNTNTNTNTGTSTTASSGSDKTSGTVTVKENVRIRSEASTDSEKIATVYMGEKLDLIEKMSNGWSKIKYKGQVAYVKSDYVE